MIYDVHKQEVKKQFLSLTGTRNCAEDQLRGEHGSHVRRRLLVQADLVSQRPWMVLQVPATESPQLNKPTALKDMGRFNHEAVAVDPNTGDVYLTEDRHEGLLYKFVPKIAGRLSKGGKLYALKVKNFTSLDTRNWRTQKVNIGDEMSLDWLEMNDIHSPKR